MAITLNDFDDLLYSFALANALSVEQSELDIGQYESYPPHHTVLELYTDMAEKSLETILAIRDKAIAVVEKEIDEIISLSVQAGESGGQLKETAAKMGNAEEVRVKHIKGELFDNQIQQLTKCIARAKALRARYVLP